MALPFQSLWFVCSEQLEGLQRNLKLCPDTGFQDPLKKNLRKKERARGKGKMKPMKKRLGNNLSILLWRRNYLHQRKLRMSYSFARYLPIYSEVLSVAKHCINNILNISKAWPCCQGITSLVKHVFPGLVRAMNMGADICVE